VTIGLRVSTAVLLALILAGCAGSPLIERDYQRWWCDRNRGEMEYRLPDGARVDCLTAAYAVEVEYAPKWAEAIGQALYYASKTGRKPGVVVIVSHQKDERFLKRLRTVAREQNIRVWTVRPRDLD